MCVGLIKLHSAAEGESTEHLPTFHLVLGLNYMLICFGKGTDPLISVPVTSTGGVNERSILKTLPCFLLTEVLLAVGL